MTRFRIVIADDNDLIRTLLGRLIEDSGDIKVVGEASDGYSAVEVTRRLVPDAVIMDVNMPKMDGLQASRVIHSEFPNIQVIGLSMFDKSDIGDKMMQAGAVTYFSKSDPLEEVISGIHHVLTPEPEVSRIA